ncbi:MAG TPA: vWA domain-containing protein [Anaeromyxobacter sp.]|nr:vWA domain-containing protein [Anaeromyxobacter sp.]
MKSYPFVALAAFLALAGAPAIGASLAGSLVATADANGSLAGREAPKPKRPLVQIALLLDTSNSMDGLINQAKAQLWKVVNELATAKRDGQHPDLRIALYEYGNSGLAEEGHWIRQVSPFTDDLDRVSEQLFALTTHGGDEYCGAVIARAVDDLGWSTSPDDLKLVFIAGNEPFTQGPIDFRIAVKRAAAKGISVNTIHCGPQAEGVATGWKEGAVLADGTFLVIDHDRVAADVPAPQDAELARLNDALNATYVPYGAHGAAMQQRQNAQDANAKKLSPSSVSTRAQSKASGLYKNSGWDLVDAARDGKVQVEALDAAELPAELRKLGPAERKAYVEQKGKERAALQKQIAAVSQARAAYVAKEQAKVAKAAQGSTDTLDSAMIKAVRAQAKKGRYTFD